MNLKHSMLFLFALLCSMNPSEGSFAHATFESFDNYCIQRLPTIRAFPHAFTSDTGKHKIHPVLACFIDKQDYKTFSGVTAPEFELALDSFFSQLASSSLADANAWIAQTGLDENFSSAQQVAYKPYAQKVLAESSDVIALRGDMHGDIHSLLNFLRALQAKGYTSKNNGFKIVDPKLKILFLGDYVDRGLYGVEVIYTILRLKIENPEQVILIRGNHEDMSICSQYGFTTEFMNKFADSSSVTQLRILEKIQKFYELLPVVAYIGCAQDANCYNFVQCCHGGIEIGFNPKTLLASEAHTQYQLLGELRQETECAKLKDHLPEQYNERSYKALQCVCKNHIPIAPASLDDPFNGFMWNDFQPSGTSDLQFLLGRGIKYSKEMTEAVLQLASSPTHKVCGIIRAHQHALNDGDPLMRQMLDSHGVARLWSESSGIAFNPWQGLVCTLLLSPDNSASTVRSPSFKGFDFDTTLFITMGPQFTDWNMQIINNLHIYADQIQHAHCQDLSSLLLVQNDKKLAVLPKNAIKVQLRPSKKIF